MRNLITSSTVQDEIVLGRELLKTLLNNLIHRTPATGNSWHQGHSGNPTCLTEIGICVIRIQTRTTKTGWFPRSRNLAEDHKREKIRKYSDKPTSPTEEIAPTRHTWSERRKATQNRRASCQAKGDQLRQTEGQPPQNAWDANLGPPE